MKIEPTILILKMQNVLTAFLASFAAAKLKYCCFEKADDIEKFLLYTLNKGLTYKTNFQSPPWRLKLGTWVKKMP